MKTFFAKNKFLYLFFAAGMMVVCAACSASNQVAVTPTPDRSPDVRADMNRYNQYFSQMNADEMASLFAPGGEVYDTGLLQASGPDAIRSYLSQTFSAAHIDSLTATVDFVFINGNVAAVFGTYNEKTTGATGQSGETKLRYVAEWIYQSNGQWLLNRVSTVKLP